MNIYHFAATIDPTPSNSCEQDEDVAGSGGDGAGNGEQKRQPAVDRAADRLHYPHSVLGTTLESNYRPTLTR